MSAAFTGSRQDAATAQGRFHAVLTCGVVLLAFLAIDDITTDSSTTFAVERAAVIACGVWFAFIARQLWRQGRRGLAVVSAAVLGLAAVAQPAIRPGVSSGQVGPIVTWIALVWFLIVAAVMGLQRIRRTPQETEAS
jgi:putative exporter of polyketide antibiotics